MSNNSSSDGTPEARLPGAAKLVPVHVIERGPRVARCVARIWQDGNPATGVLLPGNWILTCRHVLPDKDRAKAARAQFNYQRDEAGSTAQIEEYSFDPGSGFHVASNIDDDWSIVKLKGDANARFGQVKLIDVDPKVGEAITIVQHPLGDPKQSATGTIVEILERSKIRYSANSEGGSSGSPVFNASWNLIGLHHAGGVSFCDPQTKVSTLVNQGIHVNVLRNGLKSVGLWPHSLSHQGDRQLPNGEWIIERESDRSAVQLLEHREFVIAIKGGRLMGKRLIADRLGHCATALGWRRIAIDLRDDFDDEDYVSVRTFLRQLARRIVEGMNGNRSVLEPFKSTPASSAFRISVNGVKPADPNDRLVLLLHRVDAILKLPIGPKVLSVLRALYSDQRALGEAAWLQLVLVHTIKPKQAGKLGSIFDVARTVDVEDFTIPELARLASLYEIPESAAEKLHPFVGGHPQLSQIAFQKIRDGQLTIDKVVSDAVSGGVFQGHLNRLIDEFKLLPEWKDLASSFCNLVMNNAPLTSEETFESLLALGVVNGSYFGNATVRSQLYGSWLPPRLRG